MKTFCGVREAVISIRLFVCDRDSCESCSSWMGHLNPVENIPCLHLLHRKAVARNFIGGSMRGQSNRVGAGICIHSKNPLPPGNAQELQVGIMSNPAPHREARPDRKGKEHLFERKRRSSNKICKSKEPYDVGFHLQHIATAPIWHQLDSFAPFHHQFSAGAMNPTQTRPATPQGCHVGRERGRRGPWPDSAPRPSGRAPSFRRHRACLAATAVAADPAERAA